MKRYQDITDPTLAKALAHPLRTRILAALETRSASPSQLSKDLSVSLGVVSYHVRCLHWLGFLRLVKKVPRRGAVEHYYTTTPGPRISSDAWDSTPGVVKQAMVSNTLNEIGAQATQAAKRGGFADREAHLSRSPLTLDQKGWRAVADELNGVVTRIEQIEAESVKRLDRDGSGGVRSATVALMLFCNLTSDSPSASSATASGKPRKRRRPTVKTT